MTESRAYLKSLYENTDHSLRLGAYVECRIKKILPLLEFIYTLNDNFAEVIFFHLVYHGLSEQEFVIMHFSIVSVCMNF